LKFHLNNLDNQIDFAEFLNILHIHLQSENTYMEILNAFKAYDVNKTGNINVNELKSILTKTGERLSSKDGNLEDGFLFVTFTSFDTLFHA
jgi:Ca2+-binding EF-hand superfamily protein